MLTEDGDEQKPSGGFESQIVHQIERKRAKSNKSNHDGQTRSHYWTTICWNLAKKNLLDVVRSRERSSPQNHKVKIQSGLKSGCEQASGKGITHPSYPSDPQSKHDRSTIELWSFLLSLKGHFSLWSVFDTWRSPVLAPSIESHIEAQTHIVIIILPSQLFVVKRYSQSLSLSHSPFVSLIFFCKENPTNTSFPIPDIDN